MCGAEIVEVAVQHLDRSRFIGSRQRSTASFGHFEVPRSHVETAPVALSFA